MSDDNAITITPLDNGPLRVKGGAIITDQSGNRYEVKDQVFLCRCGQSSNKPFCDGTHKTAEFLSEARVPTPEAPGASA